MDPIKEILQKMQGKLDAAKEAQSPEERAELMDEFDALKSEKEAMQRVMDAEAAMAVKQHESAVPPVEESSYDKAVKQFAAAARAKFNMAMKEGTNADGGYTVPEDIVTSVEKLREAEFSLEQLVGVEKVTTNSGARTYQKRASQTGFSSVDEGGKLPLKATPQFDRYTYAIAKYAGVFPVTNELLADSDANIVNILVEWIAGESRATRNALVLAALNEKYTRDSNPATAKAIAGIDDIKTIVNVDLGQAFAPTSRIVTNDSGLDWLDKQKNLDGDYILKRANNDPLDRVVSAGSLLIPVSVVPNAVLANDVSNGVPFYIGDLKEGARLFDRMQLSIKASDVAYMANTATAPSDNALNAFQEDLTLFRAIERLDCVLRDEDAFFKGFVAPTGTTGTTGATGATGTTG